MAEKLMIQSIVTDNRITAQFTDKALPRYARHGELYVVDGILYIYADLDNSGHGRWFPLTNEKEIYTYNAPIASSEWIIPIEFYTNNLQVIVYDLNDKIYVKDFDISSTDYTVTLTFSEPVAGSVYLVVNKSFDWIDRKIIVADRRFAVTHNPTDVNQYFLEIDTEYVKILKNGNVTFSSNVSMQGTVSVAGDVSYDGDLVVAGTITSVNNLIANKDLIVGGALSVDGISSFNSNVTINANLNISNNVVINGNLSVEGITTTFNTNELLVEDNIITLNSNVTGTPTINAGVEINRGDEGKLSLLTFDETADKVLIPVKDNGLFIQDEIAGKKWTTSEIEIERNRATTAEFNINTSLTTEISNRTSADNVLQSNLDNEVARAIAAENTNTTSINTEITNRTTAVNTLQSNLDNEVARATTAESNITTLLTTEISNRTSADNVLQNQLDNITSIMSTDSERLSAIQTLTTAFTNADNNLNNTITTLGTTLQTNIDTTNVSLTTEISNRTSADNTLQSNIDIETTNRMTAINILETNLDSEVTRAISTENILRRDLDSEVTRALMVESNITSLIQTSNSQIQSNLDSEVARAITAETTLQSNLDNEVARATTAESNITTLLTTEISNRTSAINSLQTNLDTEVTRATTSETSLQNQLDSINSIMSTDSERLAAIQTLTTAFTDADNNLNNTITTLGSTLQTNIDTKANKSTTISGYGILDAYTKNDVDTTFVSKIIESTMSTSLNFNLNKIIKPILDVYTETVVSITASSQTLTLTTNGGSQFFTILLNSSISTFGMSGVFPAGTASSFTFILTQGTGGSKTITWPTNFKWEGGIKPTLSTSAGAIDVISCMTYDQGATYLAFLTSKGMS